MIRRRFRQMGLLLGLISLAVPAFVWAQGGPLTETFTSEDGALTFQYPGGWTALETEPGIYVIVEDVSSDSPVVVSLLTTPAVDDIMIQWGFDSTLGANLVGNLVSSRFRSGESEDAAMETITLEDGREAFLYLHPNPQTSQHVLWLLAFEEPIHQAVLLGLLDAPVDEADSYRDSLLAMAASVTYTPPEKVPSGTVIWQREFTMNPDDPAAIGQLSGLGVGPEGTIYLADRVNGLHVFSPAGDRLGHFSGPSDASLADVAVAADGTLWAADAQQRRVLHLDAEGILLGALDVTQETPAAAPWASAEIVIGPDGWRYLLAEDTVDGAPVYQVHVWDAQGTVQATFPVADSLGRTHMALGPEGDLYFMGLAGDFWVMDREGNPVRDPIMLLAGANTTGLVIAPNGAIFFSADWGGVWYFAAVREYAGDLAQLPTESVEPESWVYFQPGGLALLPDGDVILADSYQDAAVITRFHFDAFDGMAAVPAEPLALTETFTAEDGRLTFRYPAGWAVATAESGSVLLSNDGQALQTREYGPGDVVFHVSWSALSEILLHSPADAEGPVWGVAEESYTSFAEVSADAAFSRPESFSLNGRPAARFAGTAAGQSITVLVLDLSHDEIGIVAMLTGDPADAARFEPTLFAFAETVAYVVKLPF